MKVRFTRLSSKMTTDDFRDILSLDAQIRAGTPCEAALTEETCRKAARASIVLVSRPIRAVKPGERRPILGMMIITPTDTMIGRLAIITWLIVDQRQRRWGMGTALFRYGLYLAKKKGATGFYFFSRSGRHRKPARKLFKKLGMTGIAGREFCYRIT